MASSFSTVTVLIVAYQTIFSLYFECWPFSLHIYEENENENYVSMYLRSLNRPLEGYMQSTMTTCMYIVVNKYIVDTYGD